MKIFENLNYSFFTSIAFALILVLLVVVVLLILLLRRAERRHRDRVRKTDHSPPIETQSPIKHPVKDARRHALKSVKVRYSVIRHVLMGLALVLVLLGASFPLLGTVPATLLSGLLATFSIMIGIIARPVLENLVAGLMLTLSRAISVSDTVIINDHYGTIEDITATHMVVKRWDWRRYVIPNAKVMTTDFLNLTLRDDFQWARVEFWVASDADIDKVEAEAIASAKEASKIATHEPPHFWHVEMGKEGVRCWVTAWADSPSDAWDLKHEIRMNLMRRLTACGIPSHRHNLSEMPVPLQKSPSGLAL